MIRKKIIFRRPCRVCFELFSPSSRDNKMCELCKKKVDIHLHISRINESLSRLTNKLTKIPDNKWKVNLHTCKKLIDMSQGILSEEIKFKQRKRIKD